MAQDYFDPARAVSIGGGNEDFDPGRAELIQPAGGTASDLAKSLKVGTQRLPGMVTGLADLPFALAAGARPFTKAADALGEVTGFQPGKWADETKFSAGYEQGKKAVDDAWKDGSAGDIALAYIQNPGYTANQVVESAPSMVAGGLAGRALMGAGRVAAPAARAGGVGPAAPGLAERALGQWAAPVAAGVGEGAVTAGQQMAQYQGEDQQTNALASLGAGAVTGLVGVGAGRVANKLGLETAETAIAKAGTGAAKAADDVPLSAKRRILGGIVSEALLQELPQSAQEQMWQNWADGKPLMEGVARAATEGAIAGGVMGAGANVSDGGAGKRRALAEQQAKQLSEAEAEALMADPSRAWTTEAGAVDPNQPAGERAAPPEVPDLTTSPGAGVARDGMDFTRDVDTSGLSLQDPAELERQRAATVDYQTGDTTPQWDTQPGAAPVRSGLDMPAPDFDTGALGFDPRPLSERMGLVPAANTPLTKAAALSVDTGASPVQFLGATGRDMQLRQTGPGVADESNVIDVQGRVVEDRAIGTPRRLIDAAQPGASPQPAGRQALPAPANLREALDRIRQQRAEGERLASPSPAPGAAVPALGGPMGNDRAGSPANAVPDGLTARGAGGGGAAGTGRSLAALGTAQSGGRGNGNPALTTEAPNAQTATPSTSPRAQAVSAAGTAAVEAAGVNSGPGTDAGNGFKQGYQTGERYRVGVVDSVGGAVSLEKRLPAGTAATFYVGKDGNLIDGDTINLTGSAGRNRLWIPTTQLQASQAAEILDEMGKTALNDPKRADAKRRLKSLVTGQSAVEADGPATIPATTGVARESQASQTQQGSTQPTKAGGPQAGAATATASTVPAGGNRVQAAGLTNGTPTQNPGAQAATAAGAQAQAPQAAVARPDGWRKSMLRAAPIARAMGIDTKGKRLAQVVAEIDARDTQTPTTPAPQPAPGPVRIGRDNTPLNEGGKPFKTRKAAGDAKKLQPMMRVVTVEGGYALAEKTPAQLAAEERASRRLRSPSTSVPGEPIPAHAFIAAAGGLNRAAAADLGVEGNPRIGNRTLFAGQGRGLSIEQATQMLIQDGYLSEGALHNDAYALIKTSLTRPQYNADGIERIAQAESDARFEDYLAAQEEAAAEGDADPFGMADEFTAEELDDVGYTDADPALQAEVAALTAQADAMGIDTYAILDDIARTYANATQDQYNAKARDALAAAIARGNQDGGSTAAQAAPAAEPAQEPGLTAPTRADIEAQQEARDKAEREEAARQRAADNAASQDENRKRIAQASVRAADNFELGQDPLDSLTGQWSIFDDAPAPLPTTPRTAAIQTAQDDGGRERFTLSIELFGDVPYRASKPVDAGSGEVVSSRVITTKTKLTAANAQALGLPKDKGTVYAWRVSVIRRANGETHSVIEAMATDNGRSADGEVLAHFKPVDDPEAMDRIAPAIAKAAMSDWQASKSTQGQSATEPVAQPITRADVTAAQQQAATLIAERIDAMTAGEVNTIARRFLPTMGVKPTVSKERNKAAVTDFTKVNPMAAAAEFGVKLPADVRRALDAEMQGKVADAGQDDGLAARADGDDDYLSTLFGGSDAAEKDAVSPVQTRKIDAKAAVPMLRALAQEKRVEAEDWSSRKYKGNKSQVNLRGDGPSNQETMSVSAVNESRRRKAVESLVAQANAADKLADRIESGSINIQSALDKISSAVDSDMKRDGGKPSIGKSRQDMFEGYISSQLLADPYAGYGNGTASSALRTMYEGRAADGFVEPAAAKPAAANDRNAFTLQRLNRDTDQMEPVTFERGEYVRYTVGGKDQFGDIDGISHARREFSVDGLWYPFGFAYKAERPAAPKADTVPLSSVIDKMNAKNGQGLTDADRVPEQKPASKTPTVDRHNAAMAAVREGKATAEQFRASFEQVVSNKDAIVAELDTMTKAQLLRDGGPFVQMRYANEKKAVVVDAVYREMVGEYALGESVTYGMGRDSYQNAVRKLVEATDADKLAQYVADRKAAAEEYAAQRAAKAAALENPQSLTDYRSLIQSRINEGKTRKEAFLMLTPEQRIQYDTLEAESTKEARESRKRTAKTEVRAAGQTTGGEIIATKHTRDGYDLFVVKLADRLSADDYKTVLASAKKLGGWYSAFRGNGAIPGFQFKDKANAEAFLSLAGGDTTAAQEQVAQRRDAFEDDRSQTAVERLRAMADKLEEDASEVEGQQRKTNTERRARFASAAMASAAADKAKAQTMRNIAQAIEDGEAKFLDAVRTKSQVDMLTGIVDTAKGAELRAKYPSYADQEKRKGEPPTAETADFAEFPSYSAFRSDLATLGRQMLDVDGTKKLGQRLMSVADDVTDAYLEFAKANFQDVSRFGRGDSLADFASKDEAERAIKRSGLTGKAIVLPIKRGQNRVILSPSEAIGRGLWQGDGDKRITLTAEFGAELVESIGRRGNKQNKLSVPWQFQNAYDRRKALSRIGIETPSEFRAALREFIGLKEQAVANRTRELELQMVGRKADGLDFFPTSAEVADQMIEAADLTPDMAVLEPSAGMGHLADRIREAGAEPDVIEISADRRALLEEKGYTTQAVDDFLDLKPREFYTFGDTFRAPDGVEGIMRGANGNRVKLVNQAGDMVGAGYYDRADLTGVAHNGTASGYDRIIMNPPFSNRRDAEHVRHAYSLLKPGGRIVAIMGEGVFFGQDKKAQDFREWLESVGGTSEKLPEGSFMDPSLPVNTSVNARMVVIDKADGVAMLSRATDTKAAIGTPAVTIRAAITKAYGKLLGQLESKGLVTLTQTEDEAVEAAARARADKTGQPLAEVRASLMGSVSNSVATDDLDIRRSANGAIQGFFDPQTGQSFLIADNLTAEAAPGVLMHEVGIHMAADGSMKALFNRAAMMLKMQKGNPFMKAVQARMDAAGETSGEEAAAYIAEAYENDRANAPASVQRWLTDLLAAVKAWMFKKGIMGADRLTVADIAAVARANARSMALDGGATGGRSEIQHSRAQPAIRSAAAAMEEAIRRVDALYDAEPGAVTMEEFSAVGDARRAAEAAMLDALAQLPDSGFAVEARTSDGRMLIVTPSASEQGRWQLTRFGKDGEPWGDTRFDTKRQALQYLVDEAVPSSIQPAGAAIEAAAQARAELRASVKNNVADQTQTENFRRWFAGSKVVDAEGKPLVMYHGTRANFNVFGNIGGRFSMSAGYYFASSTQRASVYADGLANAIENWDPKSKFTKEVETGANVMPVYLSIKNPLVITNKDGPFSSPEDAFDLNGGALVKAAKDLGHDGVIYRREKGDGFDEIAAVAFRPEQVKSAIGNRGTFDPADPDIRFSRAASPSQPAAWDAPVQTGFDDVIYKLQDKNIDLKRVVESISKATGQVSDSINAYLKEELFHKRAAKRVADFGDRELKPLMNKMRLAGLSMEDVEEYLHARHAKEANAVIAQRNPGNAGLQDGGSGMTNAAADNYFAKLDPAQRRKLEAVAKSVDAIIDGTRKLYVSYGLEDQAVVDGWANMYQHYIPLMREDKDGGMGIGQGFSVKGKETKGRTGSTRKVVDILANVAMQREKLIVRGEKNIVAQALVGLAQANPNPDFWEVRSQAPTERVFDPKTGVVVERPDPLFKSRENVAVAKVKDANGKVTEQMVVFNEDNPRAVRMAAAMKNLDAGNLEGLLGVSAKITRYFAAINTQYNPVFGVVNLVRDVQGAMVNLGTTPLAGQQGKIAKDTLSALRGIYSDIRKTRKGGQATSQWSQLWEQMQDDGGTTGYRDLFKTSADRANDLQSILNPEGWMDSKWGKFFTADGRLKVPLSMAQKGATEIFGWLSDYNEAMENGVRLAAYKAALDKKMSREQAASLAKNLTVNFNRKGQAGMQAGAVYAFFNAAMQGTARIGQTLFDMDGGDLSTLRLSKTGKAVVYGGVMLGVMQALALSAAGFDDDDPPEFVRERSLIIPTGDKTYVSIPMPLGLHVIPGIGRHATEFALSGFDKPAKRAVSMVGMFADAFNPIGNAGLSMQTIAPTALDPLVALSENKDWTGKPIARVSSNKAMPGHTQWKDTATGFSKVVAEAINWVSGGNEYVAGAFSPTPDQIDYLIAQLGGGVAREAAKVQQTISTAMSGETLPTHKIPLVGRFVGNAASQASQGSAFYANLNKLNELETEIKGLRKDGRFDEASKLTRENPQSILIAMANRAERDVQRLRREKRELIANDASREQVRAKEDQITAVMTRLNEAVERRKAQAAR